jgi:hypothetical protein
MYGVLLYFQSTWKKVILWENGLGGSSGYERIFFIKMHGFQAKNQKNPFVSARSRPIRSPIVSPPSKTKIAKYLR